MAVLCNTVGRTKDEWMRTQDDIWNYWLFNKHGQERVGIVERFSDKYNGFDAESAKQNLRWFIEQRLELPYNQDAYNVFTKKNINRIKVEIDAFDKALSGKFSNLAWVVPEGISKQDPIARKFYTRLNDILNVERVNVNNISTRNAEIANHMLEAYISENTAGTYGDRRAGNKAIRHIKDLRKQMLENPENELATSDFISAMEKFIERDAEGITIKQFIDLIHMDKKTFGKIYDKDFRDPNKFLVDGTTENPNYNQKVTYNSNVVEAVKKARIILDDMGQVYVQGITTLKDIVGLKYAGTSDPKVASRLSSEAGKFIKTLDDTIKDIKMGMKEGGYFPHLSFATIATIKGKLNEAANSFSGNKDLAVGDLVDNILSEISPSKLPDSVKKRGIELGRIWEKDPFLVISEYGHQATNFNKMVHTQKNYLEALKHLPNSTMEFQKGLRRFIDEEFAVFTRGTGARGDWANNVVMTMNALQTARTMGLNITGAVKNAASALHFYSRVGFGALKNTLHDFAHDTEFKDLVRRTEKEAGFLFTDAARELYSEGLIGRTELESGEVRYNPETGEFMKGNGKLKQWLIDKGQFTLDKLLFFHRLTENNQRKWMYRVALHQKYKYLVNRGYSQDKAGEFAKRFALQTVNSWAYEYAAHGKAKAVRGEWRTIDEMDQGSINYRRTSAAGATSEMMMHLMHYPMSLAESTYSTLKGAHKAFLAGEGFESQEIMHLTRYAGIAGIVSLVSILTNTDLFNIFEHDTVERVQRTIDDLTEYDNPDKGTFGLLSQISGTNLGTLKHLMVAGGVIDIENNDLNKVLFGNVNFADEDDRHTEMYSAYQYSTFWGQWSNKLYPAIRDGRGRDLLTHWFKFYPTKTTKHYHEMIFGKPESKKKKKTGGKYMDTSLEASLNLLQGLSQKR